METERKGRAVLGSETPRDESAHLQQMVAMLTQRLEAAERAIRDLSTEIASLSDTVSGDRGVPDDTPPPVFRSAASRAASVGRPVPAPAPKPAAATAKPPAPAPGSAEQRRYGSGTRASGSRHPLASDSAKPASGGRGWAIGASLIVLALAGAAGWWYGFGREGRETTTAASGAATDMAPAGDAGMAGADVIAPTAADVPPTAEAIGPTPTPAMAPDEAPITDEATTDQPTADQATAGADTAGDPAAAPTVTVDVADDEASPDSLDDPEATQPGVTVADTAPADAPAVTAAPSGEADVAVLPPPGTTAAAPGAVADSAGSPPALPDDASPEVVRLAELAVEGNANAQHDLATAYALGNGVPRDYTTAAYWYRRAADAGMLNAIFNLGVLTDNGWGVERDPSEAFRLYLTAAEKGHPDAQNAVGLAYAQGYGTTADPTKAASWFKAASTNGNPRGAFYLGQLYERGLNGTPDLAQAAGWYQIAAEHGVAEAKDALDRLTSTGTTPTAGSDLVPAEAPPPVATDGTTPPDASTIATALEDKTELDPAGLKELQALLTGMGYDTGPADGMMGRRTRQAIDAFAAKIDVPSPSPPTRGLLEAARRASTQG